MRMTGTKVTGYLQQPDESYRRVVLAGCSWFEKSIAAVADKSLEIKAMVVVRVPLEIAPEDFSPHPGDLLVRGECTEELGGALTAAKLKRKTGAVSVQTVRDNRRGKSPHWKLEAV